MKFVAAAVFAALGWLHVWIYRFAGRTGSLPGRGGWLDRREKPRAFAVGRAVTAIIAVGLLIASVAELISN
jgi:hypothetical protein